MLSNVLLLLAWYGIIYLSRKLFRDLFTPLTTYASIWFACILLFRLRLVAYYELETKTVLLIASSIAAFVLGCVMARVGKRPSEGKHDFSGVLHSERLERAIKTLVVLNAIGVLIFAYRMNSTYGLGTYAADPSTIRADADEWTRVGLLGLLLMLDYPLLACSSAHYLLTRKWRWFTVAALFLIIAQSFLKTDRGTLTIYVITSLSIWIYWNRWRSLNWRIARTLAVMAILVLTYFLGIGLLYGKLVSAQTDVFNLQDFSVTSDIGLTLATPYVYATASLGGFQEATRDVDSLSWGTHTFFPVARILYSLGALSNRPEGFNFDFYQVPIPINTYTHLFAFYQDFGTAGVLLLPFALAYMETAFYTRMKARPSLFLLGASSVFTALNIFSVFIPLITSVSVWYFFATLYVISSSVDSRSHHMILEPPQCSCSGVLGSA